MFALKEALSVKTKLSIDSLIENLFTKSKIYRREFLKRSYTNQ